MVLMVILGAKYQSNLNEIDKSERKSVGDKSKIEWPPEEEKSNNGKIFFCKSLSPPTNSIIL